MATNLRFFLSHDKTVEERERGEGETDLFTGDDAVIFSSRPIDVIQETNYRFFNIICILILRFYSDEHKISQLALLLH